MPEDGYRITIEGEAAQIATAAELVVALDVLQGGHDREVLAQLRDALPRIIPDPAGLHAVLRVLCEEDKLYLIAALGSELPSIVAHAGALRDILAHLAEVSVEQALLKGIGPDGLRCLIRTPEQLAEVLEWVYGECDELALELLGPAALTRLIRSGADLGLVLKALDHARQEELIDMLGWDNVERLCQDEMDLAQMLRSLPSHLGVRLLDGFEREQLAAVVPDERALQRIAGYLETAEMERLEALLGVSDCAQ